MQTFTRVKSAITGDTKGVQRLIKKKASVVEAVHNGMTPLLDCAVLNHIEIMVLLLREINDEKVRQEYVNAGNENSRTPLFLASERGHQAACQVLLRSNAEVNKPDICGDTPLRKAILWLKLITSQAPTSLRAFSEKCHGFSLSFSPRCCFVDIHRCRAGEADYPIEYRNECFQNTNKRAVLKGYCDDSFDRMLRECPGMVR